MKFKHILLALVVPAAAFLASCDDTGGTGGDQKPKPTLTFQTGAGYTFSDATAAYDSVLAIGIRASTGDKKLNTILVYLSTNGGPKGIILDTATNNATFNYDFPYKVKGSAGDQQVLEVVVTDDNGEKATISLKVNIKKTLHPLVTTGGQRVNNIIGPDMGAYDLWTGTNVASSGDEGVKDLKDMTTISNPVFSEAWTSGNGTQFVRVTSNDWTNATSTDALFDLWEANKASAATKITNLAVGDYVLVKSTQLVSFNIYIIKVDVVFKTTTNNNDYIEFSYRKEDI